MNKIIITLAVLLLSVAPTFPQAGQIIRNQFSTNSAMNNVQDGFVAIWNNIAKKWSNGVLAASATNAQPPSTVLTNLSNTGVAPGATNAGFYIGSASGGTGTNTSFLNVTNRGYQTNFGNFDLTGDLHVFNGLTIEGVSTFKNDVNISPGFFQFGSGQGSGLTLNSLTSGNATINSNLNLARLPTNSLLTLDKFSNATNAYLTIWLDTNSATVLSAICSNAPAFTQIILGPGTFDIGTNYIKPPTNGLIRGSGKYTTIIKSMASITGDANLASPVLVGSDNAVFQSLGVDCARKTNQSVFTAIFGCLSNVLGTNTAFTNCWLVDVSGDSGADAIYFSHPTPCESKLVNCDIRSGWDVIVGNAPNATNTLVQCFNSRFTSIYGFGYTNVDGRVVAGSDGILRFYNCVLTATGHTNTYCVRSGTFASRGLEVDLFNCKLISLKGTAGLIERDIENADGTGIITVYGTGINTNRTAGVINYGDLGNPVVSGSITLSAQTANRMVQLNGSKQVVATDMRLASSLSGASDGQGLVYNAASGTWTNGTVGGSGEINVNGEVSVTNATRIGLVNGKSGVTNLLRSVQGGDGISLTNQGTNIMFAVDRTAVGSNSVVVTAGANVTVTPSGSGGVMTYQVASTGGSGTPGGTNKMLQFNDGGSFAGTTNFNWDMVNSRLGLSLGNNAPQFNFEIGGATPAIVVGGSFPETNKLSGTGLTTTFLQAQTIGLSNFWRSWKLDTTAGSWIPNATRFQDVGGASALPKNSYGANFIGANLALPSNGHLNGSNQSYYVNLNSNMTVTLTNFNQDETYELAILNTNNSVLTWANIPLASWLIGAATSPWTNGQSRFFFRIDSQSGLTNVWDQNYSWAIQNGPNNTLSTNTSGIFYIGGLTVATNGTLVASAGAPTNINWTTGVTGYVSGATLNLGVSASGGTGATNTPVLAAGYLHITNQIMYADEFFNGGTATTNLDFVGSVIKNMTNALTGNATYNLTNAIGGRTMTVWIKGETATASDRTVTFNAPSSANLRWNAATNGSLTFTANSNQYYTAVFTVVTNTTETNIIATWVTTSPQPIRGSAILIAAGSGTSNAVVAGLMYQSTTSFTNLNGSATLSNLANVTIPAHQLTNNGDFIEAKWDGVMPTGQASTNQFTIVYGSQTVLDTGLQTASNTVFRGWAKIKRTGNTSQHVDAYFEWGPGNGVPFAFTNANLEIAQTNGIGTLLAMQNASRRVGAITNNNFEVYYQPATR